MHPILFYELVKAQLYGETHWQESDDPAMMFYGTYNSEFYRAVKDLLHARVEREKSNSTVRSEAYRDGKSTLKRRWHDLVSAERRHRNDGARRAVACFNGGCL